MAKKKLNKDLAKEILQNFDIKSFKLRERNPKTDLKAELNQKLKDLGLGHLEVAGFTRSASRCPNGAAPIPIYDKDNNLIGFKCPK